MEKTNVARAVKMARTNVVNREVVNREVISSNLPEKKFRAGAISATVWLNQGTNKEGEATEYRTISIERNYTDKEGKWHTTNSMRIGDLPKLNVVTQKAYEYLIFAGQDSLAA